MFGKMLGQTYLTLGRCNSSSLLLFTHKVTIHRSQDEVSRVDRMSEEVGTIQALRNSFTPILNIILTSLDAPAIFMRTKALRALGQIITSDANILSAVRISSGLINDRNL